MEAVLKNSGQVLLVIGVLCLAIYRIAYQTNVLLVLALVFEVAGILIYIFSRKKLDK